MGLRGRRPIRSHPWRRPRVKKYPPCRCPRIRMLEVARRTRQCRFAAAPGRGGDLRLIGSINLAQLAVRISVSLKIGREARSAKVKHCPTHVRENDRQLVAQFRASCGRYGHGQARAGNRATGWLCWEASANVSRLVQFPDLEITKAVLEGQQPTELTATQLIRSALTLPLLWPDQIDHVGPKSDQ